MIFAQHSDGTRYQLFRMADETRIQSVSEITGGTHRSQEKADSFLISAEEIGITQL